MKTLDVYIFLFILLYGVLLAILYLWGSGTNKVKGEIIGIGLLIYSPVTLVLEVIETGLADRLLKPLLDQIPYNPVSGI